MLVHNVIIIYEAESTADVMQRPRLYLFVGYLAKLSVARIYRKGCMDNR
jgi:hypothetical protein